MKKTLVYFLIVTLLMGGTLTWFRTSRINDHTHYHVSIARESINDASIAIRNFVQERRRLVKLFASENLELLRNFATNTENQDAYEALRKKIVKYFPDYFAFTVASTKGEPLYEDFEGWIGDLCIQDIRSYAKTNKHLPRIHPHTDVYHFDIMTTYGKNNEGILFISFDADILGKILKGNQTPGHKLMLVLNEVSHLIEATDQGARNNLDRDDYRLTAEEKSRILASTKIPGTVWHATDFKEKGLISSYSKKITTQMLVVFAVYLLISSIMIYYLRREERLRLLAEQHKEDFLSIVTHELRTPITAIRGSLSLIKNGITGNVTPETLEFIDIAERNSQRLSLLVNDILDLQKIEAGKFKIQKSTFNLVQTVQNAINNNLTYAEQFNIKFNYKPQVKTLNVIGDEARIIQVISNLLSNAAKYGKDNDLVDITIEKKDKVAVTSITDHGEGIPDELKDKIFNKFVSENNERKGRVMSTGLGLNISKIIIDCHDGYIGFNTSPGYTTFFFELPLAGEE